MRFQVHAAEKETGDESVFDIEADTVEDARRKANAAGYLVSKVEPLFEAGEIKGPTKQRGNLWQAVWRWLNQPILTGKNKPSPAEATFKKKCDELSAALFKISISCFLFGISLILLLILYAFYTFFLA